MRFDKDTLARIAPGIGPQLKFSPRLFSWVRKHRHWDIEAYLVGRSTKLGSPGEVYIGMMSPEGFTGKTLSSVLCAIGSIGYYPQIRPDTAKHIPDFWERYFKWGRCAIDPEHTSYFLDERWDLKPSGNHRECRWCGHCQEKVTFIHTEERSRWEDSKK